MSTSTERYSRQTGLPEIGREGQEKLRRARVLIVGVGGLGSPISTYLTGAGIGHLGLVDDDVVSESNLHRQVLYTEAELGQPKVDCAIRRLTAMNHHVDITGHACRFTADNADALAEGYDIIVDGCDNYDTRYLLDDTARRHGIPYVYGAVSGFQGQATVFNLGTPAHHYRDLYPTAPPAPTDRSLVGMTPAVIGSIMAHEVIKIVCGYGPTLAGRLWTIDLRQMSQFTLDL
jgi:adenylyltransferase/sulfurtransferase